MRARGGKDGRGLPQLFRCAHGHENPALEYEAVHVHSPNGGAGDSLSIDDIVVADQQS